VVSFLANCASIVAADHGAILGDQPPEPDGGGHLAVGEVVRDHPGRPLIAGRAIELLVLQAA